MDDGSAKRLIKLKNIPLLGAMLQNFENDSVLIGPITAAKNLVKKSRTNFHVVQSNNTKQILLRRPCIIAFNHPYEIETFASIAALPQRQKVKLVISANILTILPNIKPYIVPVIVDHHATQEKKTKLSGKITSFFSMRPQVPPLVAHEFNINSFHDAANFIKNGGLVLLAPEGFRGKNGRWFSGIGHLIKNVGPSKDIYYVSCFIKNTSNLDWFRLFPFISRFLPTIIVYFSEPYSLRNIIASSHDPKTITSKLELKYKEWAETL